MASETAELDEPAELADAKLSTAGAWRAGIGIPLKIGEIRLDGHGRFLPRDSTVPLHFGFAYRGVEYHAEVDTASVPQVRLTADLGKLPFTMEIGEGRRLIRRILAASAGAPHGCIGLSKDDDIRLEAVSTPPEPLTPASLMATLAALLFDFQPYLEIMGRVLDGAYHANTNDQLLGRTKI